VAPQQKLGLLSERRAWTGSLDSAHIDSCGSDLNDKHDEETRRAHDPSQTEAFMKRRTWVCGPLLVCALAVTGCATVQKVLPTAAWHQARVRNEGYSLLYQLMSQNSDVAKILIIKHADPPVADVIKEIASTCGQAKKELDLLHEKDRHLSFEMTNLPQIEQQTRAAIQSTVTKQLLTSSGKTFERRLLFTQAESMNYAAHLAKVLYDQESDPARKKFLDALSDRCTTLHDKVIDLLK
jgi:hypothetical protein